MRGERDARPGSMSQQRPARKLPSLLLDPAEETVRRRCRDPINVEGLLVSSGTGREGDGRGSPKAGPLLPAPPPTPLAVVSVVCSPWARRCPSRAANCALPPSASSICSQTWCQSSGLLHRNFRALLEKIAQLCIGKAMFSPSVDSSCVSATYHLFFYLLSLLLYCSRLKPCPRFIFPTPQLPFIKLSPHLFDGENG